MDATYRIGEAAEILGVRVETLRRWEREARSGTTRTAGWQRLVAASRSPGCSPSATGQGDRRERPEPVPRGSPRSSATSSRRPSRSRRTHIGSSPFVTREAVDEMGLQPGMRAVATVKATNVMLEVDE